MFTINVQIRIHKGKSSSRRLRLANKCPAIIYGGDEAPISIELDQDIILNTQTKEGFYSEVWNMLINGQEHRVKIQAVQRHSCKPKLTHIDFIRV